MKNTHQIINSCIFLFCEDMPLFVSHRQYFTYWHASLWLAATQNDAGVISVRFVVARLIYRRTRYTKPHISTAWTRTWLMSFTLFDDLQTQGKNGYPPHSSPSTLFFFEIFLLGKNCQNLGCQLVCRLAVCTFSLYLHMTGFLVVHGLSLFNY